jgi:hypothetical protein
MELFVKVKKSINMRGNRQSKQQKKQGVGTKQPAAKYLFPQTEKPFPSFQKKKKKTFDYEIPV